jgi:hypothetical protein
MFYVNTDMHIATELLATIGGTSKSEFKTMMSADNKYIKIALITM